MSADDDELLQEFLVECHENLDRLEREVVAIETQGASTEAVAAIFRTLHTVKGNAGFFGFDLLQRVAHTAENLLALVRDGERAMSRAVVTVLLEVADACRRILAAIEARAGEGGDDHAALIGRLTALQAGGDAEVTPPVTPAPSDDAPAGNGHGAPAAHVDTTVRVDVRLLETLLDLAGELVLARNQLVRVAADAGDSALAAATQRVDLVTSELQASVMKARMQPISGAWAKLPRVVRDLAGELGKRVRLELDGGDTGLDRTVLETIRDPLTHLVRNAVDHGIEAPGRRTAIGKPAEGVLRLRASHEGGQVSIEIADDGGGIDPERVRAKAVERGVLSAERAAAMSDADLVQLVFAPGFSTAEQVTNVSGRGVGMDVVKTNIERIGGVVEVRSAVGAGTSIRIKIPLTLAIIPTLTVSCNGDRYSVPHVAVQEIVVAPVEELDDIYGAPVYRLRDALIPLVDLGVVLGGAPVLARAPTAFFVVVRSEGHTFGLVVDDVHDTDEIVVKPLDPRLRHLAPYAGATILGDGRVVLLLDVRGIAVTAGMSASSGRGDRAEASAAAPSSAPELSTFLVARAGSQQVAVPLGDIVRLEDLATSGIERAGGCEVVQYRGRMLSLVRVAAALGYGGAVELARERVKVIVARAGARELGLVFDAIVDVVEEAVELETPGVLAGVRGSAIVSGRVTDVLDVAGLATAVAGLAEAATPTGGAVHLDASSPPSPPAPEHHPLAEAS